VNFANRGRIVIHLMHPPVLIVLHNENSTPGRIGNALRDLGFPLDIRRPRFGDALPNTMAGHAGAVIFGGPMSANDKEDFVRREIEWIKVPLEEGKPYLGICLGAQMMARLLGAKVWFHPEGQVEIGYYPIYPTDLGQRIFGPWPEHVYQWHREGFDLPSGGELIASGDAFPTQAFRYGSGYGLQFHPDVTHAMMCRWTTRGHERMKLPGAKSRVEHFADRAVHDLAARGWLASFLQHWLACGTGRCAVTSADRRADRL
jgi:GMP synthase (glutamine-hydrolysing)